VILLFTTFILLISYAFLLLYLHKGWQRSIVNFKENENRSDFTILICFRNESASIIQCIESVVSQQYDKQKFNIIAIDDHSSDDSFDKVNNSKFINSINLIKNNGLGKKQAITTGINAANTKYILTIDADCIAPEYWLANFDKMLSEKGTIKMLCGPVIMRSENKTIVNCFQEMESCINNVVNANGISRNHYYICSGANLCYEKQAFIDVDGYSSNEDIASGDDVFLISKFSQAFPMDIVYMANENSAVVTNTQNSYLPFIKQRKRWASKTIAYASTTIIALQALVFLTSLTLILSTILLTKYPSLSVYVFFAWLVKLIVDFYFLSRWCKYYKVEMNKFVGSSLFYSWYILNMALYSLLYKGISKNKNWK
jgi:cellulose synthase/poly-beta-1,6-N-acetylglucosamine synthase-like glycosyltransferase